MRIEFNFDVNVVSAFALLISGIAVFISMHSERRNRKLNRPAIILKDDTRYSKDTIQSHYYLYIINIGHNAAVNVVIPDEYIQKYTCFSEWYELRRELLPDGGKTTCASANFRLFKTITDIEIYYEDYAGNKYATVYKNGRFSFKKGKR